MLRFAPKLIIFADFMLNELGYSLGIETQREKTKQSLISDTHDTAVSEKLVFYSVPHVSRL